MPAVARLDLAMVELPDWHPEAASTPQCPVYGYVIDHPDGAIVVDTGVGVGNGFIDEVYRPRVTLLGEALRTHGIELDDVVAIVNSHLHFDHCGQNPLFHERHTAVFVQQAEIDAVETDPFSTDASWALGPAEDRRVLSGDEEIAEGVTILSTPGHTAGHQSVLVDAAGERIVIAGQAVWAIDEYVDEIATPSNVDAEDRRGAAVDSIRRIKALRPQTVYFSHCAEHRESADGA